jgi:hypothetical protein
MFYMDGDEKIKKIYEYKEAQANRAPSKKNPEFVLIRPNNRRRPASSRAGVTVNALTLGVFFLFFFSLFEF